LASGVLWKIMFGTSVLLAPQGTFPSIEAFPGQNNKRIFT